MFFLVTALVSGMAVTVVELAAARLIAPFFGASLFVWTNVIGIILVGLALGYRIGGRFADRTQNPHTLYHIIGTAGLFVAITPFLARPLAEAVAFDQVAWGTLPTPLIIGSFLSTALLFLLPIALLGMTSPFLIAIAVRTAGMQDVGTVSGRIFAWSTVGSIAGIFGTGILFIPLFGTRATILGAAIALLILAVVGTRRWWWGVALVATLVLAIGMPASPLRATAGLLLERESPYQYVRVNEVNGKRYLIVNEGTGIQSVWDPTTIETGYYYDYLAVLPTAFPADRPMKVLLVGLGGGTLPRSFAALYGDRDYAIDAVEIDPVIAELARDVFMVPREKLQIHIADGRTWLAQSRDTYDLIILDAYAQQHYVPWHLTTAEFFADVRDHLAPTGLVAMNVAAGGDDSPLLLSLAATVGSALPWTAIAPLPNSLNAILLAGFSAPILDHGSEMLPSFLAPHLALVQAAAANARPTTARILTDDHAPVELLTDGSFVGAWAQHR